MKQSPWTDPLVRCNIAAFSLWVLYVLLFNLQLDLGFGDCVRSFRFYTVNADYLTERYTTWTSRLLIESLLLPLARNPQLFRIINMVVMAAMPLLVFGLLRTEKNGLHRHLWLVIFLVSLYPIDNMSTAGWRATFVNYYYPAAAGIAALSLRRKKGWQRYLLPVLLLFACNQEQVCFLLTALFGLDLIVNRRQFSGADLLPLLLCLASLIFIVTTPGNSARLYSSALLFEPGYLDHSLLYKAYTGFEETALHYFYNFQPIYLTFAVTLFFSWKRMSGVRGRRLFFPAAIAFVQPLFLLLFGRSDRFHLLAPGHLLSFGLWLQFLLAMALSLGIVWMLYCAFREELKARLALVLFALGFTSKAMLGLSPSIFSSTLRTAIFCDFILIWLTLMLIDEHRFFGLQSDRRPHSAVPVTALLVTVAVHLFTPTIGRLH